MNRLVIFLICLGLLTFSELAAQPVSPQQSVPASPVAQPPPAARRDSLPFMKYPRLPAFNILLQDSSTIFNTFNIPNGRPVALVFFDPDCKHCKRFTEALIRGMDSVKNVDFYMFTMNHNMKKLRDYYVNYGLDKFSNIKVMGRDYEFFFMTYYEARSFPAVAIYDEKKNLAGYMESVDNASDVYRLLHQKARQ